MTQRFSILAAGVAGFAAVGLLALVVWSPSHGANPGAGLAVVPSVQPPASAEPDAATAEPGTGVAGEDPDKEQGAAREGEQGAETEEDEATAVRKRDEWFIDQRETKGKKTPKNAYTKARAQAAKLVNLALTATDPLDWSELGPAPFKGATDTWYWGGSTPYGGRVTSIANHPTDKDTAYVGTAMGGVWKTTNGGQTWTPFFDNANAGGGIFPSTAIGAVALDPNAPNTVYVGTGEANDTGGYFGTGLWRTPDGGQHWDKLGGSTFDQCGFSSIVVQPNTGGQVVVVGVNNSLADRPYYTSAVTLVCSAGIWRTDTGGETAGEWTRRLAQEPTDIVMSPNRTSTWYAGVYGKGVYKSTDSGQSWGSPLALSPAPASIARVDVAAVAVPNSPTSEQAVYVAVGTPLTYDATAKKWVGGEFGRLYYSPNSGATWTASTNAVKGYDGFSFCHQQCSSYDLAVAAHPTDPSSAWVGGVFLNGVSSTTASTRLIGLSTPSASSTTCPLSVAFTATTNCLHVDIHVLTFDAANRLWVGSDGGVWRTDNPKATTPVFTNMNEGIHALMYYPGISGTIGTQLIAGAQDNGVNRLPANSSTGSLMSGGDGGYQAVVPGGSNGMTVASIDIGQTYRYQNGVYCNWSPYPETNGAGTPFIAAVVPGATTGVVYAAGTAIYRTTNAASADCATALNWRQVSQAFAGSTGKSLVQAIAPAPKGDLVYAGMLFGSQPGSGQVYVGTVSATWNTAPTTWANKSSGLPNRSVIDIWVSPTNSLVAYLVMSGWNDAQNPGHVFKTINGGTSWTPVSGNLPNVPSNAIVVDTRSAPNILYVGTDVGVFWSMDDGTTWQNTSHNLPATVVHDLLLDTASNKLIAATFGRGLWKVTPINSTPSGPANDNFANATVVSTLDYAKSGITTTNASTETGEDVATTPAPCDGTGSIGKTVWFRYTPATNVTVSADTANSSFDTVLTAFRGTTLTGLAKLACDDDSLGGSGPSRIAALALTAGQTYYFRVGGYTGTSGTASGTLNFNLKAVGPANNAFAGATTIGALPYSIANIDTTLATTEASEPTAPNCSPALTIGATLWWKYVPATTIKITADTASSNFDTVLALYQGTTLAGLTPIACDDDSVGGAGASRITGVTLTGGQTYYFQAGGIVESGNPAKTGTLAFKVAVTTTNNDGFAGATAVGTLPFTATGSNAQTNTEQGEDVKPSCVASTEGIGNTLWYKLTPASAMNVTIDLAGSSFDTVAVLFSGTSLPLTEVACDDDGVASSGASQITAVGLAASQTYYLQVGGWTSSTGATATGTINLRIANIDSFAGAGVIRVLPYDPASKVPTITFNTANATVEAGENTTLAPAPCTGVEGVGKTVWFKYTPSANTTITATTSGSSFDTVLAITTSLGGAKLACNDDAAGSGGYSELDSVPLTGGVTYYLQIGGWQAASGTLTFKVSTP